MRLYLFCFYSLLTALPSGLWAADPGGPQDAAQALASKSFQIRNHKYGDLLRPQDANSADGIPIVLYPAGHWKCMTWRFHPAGESSLQIQNHFTSKTFAAEAGNQSQLPVSQVPFAKNHQDRPAWQLTRLSDGSYKITDLKSGKALTAAKRDSAARVSIVIEKWRDGEDQKWDLIEIDPKTLTM